MTTEIAQASTPVTNAAPVMPDQSSAPQVYAAISAVQKDIANVGIGKDRTTTGGARFNFRGIDDVYNALSPIMARHGLIVAPRYSNREIVERKGGKSGNAVFYITIMGDFDFVSAKDGSKHTVTTFGEAMDSGDKGTNKAMAIAHKYALLQVFAIPTEGDNDPDNYTHEPQPYQGNNNQWNNQQPQQNNFNNQTQVISAQPTSQPAQINQNLPMLDAPREYVAENKNGKIYDSNGRRLFSADEFKKLIQSVQSGEFTKQRFMDGDKYFYSDQQFNLLQNL